MFVTMRNHYGLLSLLKTIRETIPKTTNYVSRGVSTILTAMIMVDRLKGHLVIGWNSLSRNMYLLNFFSYENSIQISVFKIREIRN